MDYPQRYLADFEWLMGIEGFYSDHPDDPGGETAWGISRRFWPQYWLNAPPSRDVALGFYWTEFWKPLRIQELMSSLIGRELFEGAVLLGAGRAVRIAQQSVNTIAFTDTPELAEDGRIGPKTLQSLNWWGQRYPEALFNTMNILQGVLLISRNRRSFIRGWMSKRIQAVQGK